VHVAHAECVPQTTAFPSANQDRTITVSGGTLRGVPRYAVHLRFASGDDRRVVVARLREIVPVDALTDADDGGVRLAFDDAESPVDAVVRAQILIHSACTGTGVLPALVRRTPCA
jgi:hypothetical protein